MAVTKHDRLRRPEFERPNPVLDNEFTATVSKTLHGVGPRPTWGRVKVHVEGERLAEGPQTAQALGLLGIDEEALDDAWEVFVIDENGPAVFNPGKYRHQDGMGWQVDIEVHQEVANEVPDLAYVDPRTIERTITYRANKWEPILWGLTEVLDPGPPTVIYDVERVMPSGALGSFWSGVTEDDITSTRQAADALSDARTELERALAEMDVAIGVAKAAWKGPRADVTVFKLAMEYEIVDGTRQLIDGWEQTTRQLVEEQEKARDQDVALIKEIGKQLGITVAAGLLTFGAGSAARATTAGLRIYRWAREVQAIRAVMSSQLGQRATTLARTTAAVNTARVLARGTADRATNAAISASDGKSPMGTWRDWAASYLVVGAVGHGANVEMARILKGVEHHLGPGLTGATTGAGAGIPQAAGLELVNPDGQDAAGLIAGYAVGVPAGALSNVMSGRSKAEVLNFLQQDARSRQAGTVRTVAEMKEGGEFYDPKAENLPFAERVAAYKRRLALDRDESAGATVDPVFDTYMGVGEPVAAAAARDVATGGPISGER